MKRLTTEELSGVVGIYPWFSAARKELCRRMASVTGSEERGGRLFAESALHLPCRKKLSEILETPAAGGYADADIKALIESQLKSQPGTKDAETGGDRADGRDGGYVRKVHIVGGDYFSASDYDGVRGADDNFFRRIPKAAGDRSKDERDVPHLGFYTQTLAEIYAEQGYFDEAKQIYSQLILAYPEKSAYFASLIEKLG